MCRQCVLYPLAVRLLGRRLVVLVQLAITIQSQLGDRSHCDCVDRQFHILWLSLSLGVFVVVGILMAVISKTLRSPVKVYVFTERESLSSESQLF